MIIAFLLLLLVLYAFEMTLQKSFIAPLSLMLLSFIMASGLITANIENWEVAIYDEFVVYCLTAIIAFAIGCLMVETLFSNSISLQNFSVSLPRDDGRHYPAKTLFIVSLICSLAYVLLLMKDIPHTEGFSNVLKEIYKRATTENTSNFVLHQMLEIVIAISKISVFQLLINYFIKKEANKRLILATILLALSCMLISTDRNIFLRFVIYALCLWVLFCSYCIDKNKKQINRFIFQKSILIVGALAFLFFAMGKAKGYTSSFERMIGIYGGSGLYNFNCYLHSFSGQKLQFGDSTFFTLKNTFRALGIIEGSSINKPVFDQMIINYSSNGYVYASNIYSAMKPYLDDYGYFGMYIYPLLLGAFFEMLYYFTKVKHFGFSWVIYALLIYPVVYFTIAEQFFLRLHLGIVYEVGWVAIFYVLIYGKQVRFSMKST